MIQGSQNPESKKMDTVFVARRGLVHVSINVMSVKA